MEQGIYCKAEITFTKSFDFEKLREALTLFFFNVRLSKSKGNTAILEFNTELSTDYSRLSIKQWVKRSLEKYETIENVEIIEFKEESDIYGSE